MDKDIDIANHQASPGYLWLRFGVLTAVAWVRFPVRETQHTSVGCHAAAVVCGYDAESYATGISNTSRVTRGGQDLVEHPD